MLKNNIIKTHIYLTVFVSGAVVLVLELLGTRIIAPYYGTTVYVWASLIGVALVGLAAGYSLGGFLSDRRNDSVFMYLFILIGAVLIILIPLILRPVLNVSEIFGARFGSLFAAFILFFGIFVALGSVAPYAVKITADDFRHLGLTAGSLYAVSTIGGFAGAIAAGYFLIPALGIGHIINICGGLLAVMGITGMFLKKKNKTPALMLIIIFVMLQFMFSTAAESGAPERISVLYEKSGNYGKIYVIDRAGRYRYMVVDGAVQTYIDKNDDTFASGYINMLYDAAKWHEKPEKALVIGLGGGSLGRLLENHGVETLNIDINPEIVKAAQRYFGFEGEYEISDGRRFLRRTNEKYDMIFFDVFNGYSVYPFMFSKESFELAKKRLNKNGILAMNIVGTVPGENGQKNRFDRSLRDINETLESVFENVHTRMHETGGLASYVFYASERPFENRYKKIIISEKGNIITDDHNPLDYNLTGLVEKWREYNYKDFLKELPLI